ncbi:solute carrier family 13 member 2 [Ciona intestinalis]
MAVPYWIKQVWEFRSALVVILTPLLLLPLPLALPGTESSCGYIILIMAIYWITEAIPLAVTSLIPLILFPLTGIMTSKEVSKAYFTDTNWLFIGGLMIAVGIENSGLHRRIAIRVLMLFGTKPRRLMAGFMVTTFFLSMWISNTATTAMMLPIIEAVFIQLKENELKTARQEKQVSVVIFYAPVRSKNCTTKMSDPRQTEDEEFTDIAVKHLYGHDNPALKADEDIEDDNYHRRQQSNNSNIDVRAVGLKKSVPPIVDWPTMQKKFPWSVALLLAGGFALASGATKSGFSVWMGNQLAFLGNLEPWLICFVITIVVCLFTECSSNTATTTLFVPILAQLAQILQIHPLFLLISPVLAASLAFMLPVATPPNAIAFSYGHLKVLDLVKAGWVLNIIGVLVLTFFINTFGISYFHLNSFPDWAALPSSINSTAMPMNSSNTTTSI